MHLGPALVPVLVLMLAMALGWPATGSQVAADSMDLALGLGRAHHDPRPQGQLYAADEHGNHGVRLLPGGLLDESLLKRGSFRFGAKLVKFQKLKVLGNVYVQKVNGRPLRDSYLIKEPGGSRTRAIGGPGLEREQPTAQPLALTIS